MDNLLKIKRFSKFFHLMISLMLILIPIYYVLFWIFINHLPSELITVNLQPTPLIPNKLSVEYQVIGFIASLFPLSALCYGLLNIRMLFSFYKQGVIFSFKHVSIFKNTAKALILWVVLSMIYESAKSVLFSLGNPPGSRVIQVSFNAAELTTLIVGGIAFIIAWVMDEGRAMAEEQELTV